MGCCLVKTEDFVGAQKSFLCALKRVCDQQQFPRREMFHDDGLCLLHRTVQECNKESLQMLSMVMRKLTAGKYLHMTAA